VLLVEEAEPDRYDTEPARIDNGKRLGTDWPLK
jgi:hypothetical protein